MALTIKTNKCCYFCDVNLPVGAAIPLFTVTRNKEFTGKNCFTADGIVLAELLKSVGLDLDANTSSSPSAACKKCARKIVNCSALFHELKGIVIAKTASISQSAKRLCGNRSPSGSTPDPKKAKDIPQEPQEKEQREPTIRARKSLFELNATWTERERLEDAVANLMCLPVTSSESAVSIVKIFIAYSGGRVVEHECTGAEELLVKNLGLKNYKTAAVGVTKFLPLHDKVLAEIGREINRELKAYSKDPTNIYKYRGDLEKLADFRNDHLIKDIQQKAPKLHCLVSSSFPRNKKMKNSFNKEALIFASMINPWIPNSHFTFRINTILVLGGCKKEEMDCFNKLGLASHPNTVRNMQMKACVAFDKVATEWKDAVVTCEKKIRLLEEVLNFHSESIDEIDNGMEVCTIDFSKAAVSNCENFSEAVFTSCKQILPESAVDLYEDTDFFSALSTLKGEMLPKFRIVGDNWDLEVKARYQTKSQNNKSLHYFHGYAVKDRVVAQGLDNKRPQKTIGEIEMREFLPTPEVQEAIVSDLVNIIPRVLVKYLTPYSTFKKAVIYHIPHPHSKEMVEKSEVCPLGLQFLNPNKAAEMAQILQEIQSKYVPTVTNFKGGETEVLQKVIFDGDQLTEERARNCQWANTLARTQTERLEGITPAFADWHLKKMFLGIFRQLFFKETSAAEMGTSCASMNRTAKSNAKKGPEEDYNAFKDFVDRETEAHIISRWMVFAGITDMKGSPRIRLIPDTSDWDLQMKKEWLHKETQVFLDEVFLRTSVPENVIMLDEAFKQGFTCRNAECGMQFPLHSTRVRHEQERHGLIVDDGGDDNRDKYGYYKCRGPCSLVFATNATRKRHESVHPNLEIAISPPPEDQFSEESPSGNDSIYNYHNARLQIGMLFMDIVDAIKEGDGYRLVNCYKFVLLFAYKFKHTKYAYALLLFFVLTCAVLSKEESFSLIVNRFINSIGKWGGNIPLDLFMEHLNLLLKRLGKGMGGNMTTASLQRAAQSVVPLNNVMKGIYEDCSKVKRSGHHGSKNPEEAVQIIVNDLLKGNVFEQQPGRSGYPSFAKFKSNILDVDYRDFFQWSKDRLREWKGIYEVADH